MTTGLITVRPDMPLPAAARLFCRHVIKSLPVVEVDMTLRGIVLQAACSMPWWPRGARWPLSPDRCASVYRR
ncbi:hypothetical protein T8T21_18105 (plasmid) [Limimaricola variabilis]|jgi:CBS domain-containing membrane protein|uniref:CBS domain-containing protein n=1 Tax=Limimaricola variabilis TaxID=1492771 RepID=UPI002AC98D66|nr:CBS domain-containing protein [Limimaricola variabilis]WPY96416.1 hypothetical protein T8T21_18105 [Limimaricola variabilis]